jgi:hypothetical protein
MKFINQKTQSGLIEKEENKQNNIEKKRLEMPQFQQFEIEQEKLFEQEEKLPFEEKEEEKEEKKEEKGIPLTNIEEFLYIMLVIFHSWFFEQKLKKKRPEQFEERVLPLWKKIFEKYNLMITEEIALLMIYIFAIYTAEPIEKEQKKEEKQEEKNEEKDKYIDKYIETLEKLDKLNRHE